MSFRLNDPTETQYTFYGAAKDRSGNYSEPAEITLYYPQIEQITLDESLVSVDNNVLEVTLPKVRDRVDILTGDIKPTQERSNRKVSGYVVRLSNVEFFTGETYDDKEIWIDANKVEEARANQGNYVVTLELPKYSAWDVKVGAYDSVSHPDHNATLFENTFSNSISVYPPSIPANITDTVSMIEKTPADPTNFRSMIDSDRNVRILWDSNSDEIVSEFRVETSYNSDFANIEETFYNDSNHLVVSGLGADETVYFRVTAIGLSIPRLSLDWDDNPVDDNVQEYEIQYKIDENSNWQQVTTEDSSSYLELEANTTYEFRLRAINEDDRVSKWSNTITVSFPSIGDSESNSLTGNVNMPALLSQSVEAMEDAWQNMNTLMDSDFYNDPQNFSGENITPNTVKTQAISIGSPMRPYDLQGIDFTPNKNNNRGDISWSSGQLVRILSPEESESDFDITVWDIDSGIRTGLTTGTQYYVYARCGKDYSYNTSIEFSTTRPVFDDGNNYNFMIGVLDTNVNPAVFASSYGFTFIDGGHLTTGTIDANNANIIGGGGAVKIDGAGIRGGTVSGGEITDVKFEITSAGDAYFGGELQIGTTLDGSNVENVSGSQSKADTAEENAITHSDNYLDDLGFLSYAQDGTTLIQGGYLQTVFVDAERMDTGVLNTNNVTIQTDLGDTFELDNNGLYINSANFTLQKDGSLEATEFSLQGDSLLMNKNQFSYNITGATFELDSQGINIDTEDFTLNKDGSAVFKGNLEAASGKLGDEHYYVDFDGANLDIKTQEFEVINGNATFSGNLEAATGTFSGDITSEGTINYGNLDIKFAAPHNFDVGSIDVQENYIAENKDDNNVYDIDLSDWTSDFGWLFIYHEEMSVLSGLAGINVTSSHDTAMTGGVRFIAPGHVQRSLGGFSFYIGIVEITDNDVAILFEKVNHGEDPPSDAKGYLSFKRHSIN